ncbi:ATP-binding protein [Kitasatospora sp. NPDC001664]
MAMTAQAVFTAVELVPSRSKLTAARTQLFLLPYLPASAGAARTKVSETLSAWGVRSVHDAALVACELVTNSIKTGCLTKLELGVQLLRPDRLRIHVRDGSRALPVRIITDDRNPLVVSGRGLQVVDALSLQWGCNLEPYGKTTYADLNLR